MDEPRSLPPYTALAAGYDLIMDHVDYPEWAEYLHRILAERIPEGAEIVELGCGTGSLALELQPMGDYRYLATDRSEPMIRVARWKAGEREVPIRFRTLDFTDLDQKREADAVVLVYDGLNYLLETELVRRLYEDVRTLLRPGGVFLFDQSTPANSESDPAYFEDEGAAEEFRYRRSSEYDPETRHHVTRFEMEIEGRTYREEHVQRAYSRAEIRALLSESPLSVEAAYDGFTRDPPDETSGRIHWVTRLPHR